MQVFSEGGLPVSSIVWQSSTGAWAFTAVCKLTFALQPGVAPVAEQQEPVNEDDNYWNDDDTRSLVAPSDLAPFKPRADVLLVGHAFAPDRRPVRSLVARVCAGEVDKSIEIFGDRSFEPDGRVREGASFVKMPLRYERASGGSDLWNPVGVPFDVRPDGYGRIAIANLQPPGTFVQWRGDTFGPIGLGPIAPSWPGRMEKLHRHALRWSHRDWHARPLPADLDLGYFNAAPTDQQTDVIHENERLLLEHLHPAHPRLVTSLPGLAPRAEVERASGHREHMDLLADTLWIDTDRAICTVTWRGRIGLVHAREEGVVRIRVDGLRASRGFVPGSSADSMVDAPHAGRGFVPESSADSVADAPHAGRGFVPGSSSDSMVDVPRAGRGAAAATEGRPSLRAADTTATLVGGLESLPGPVLPFEASPWRVSALAAPGAERPTPKDAGGAGATVFLPPSAARATDTLPFASKPEASPVMPFGQARSPFPVDAWPAAPVAPGVELDRTESAPLVPLGTPSPSPSWEPLRMREPARSSPEVPSRDVQSAHEDPAGPPAPPPMIGPLARPGMEPPKVEDPPTETVPEAAPVAAPKPAEPKKDPEPDLGVYPIERCARIAVSIACRPVDAAKILEENELSDKAWDKVKNHWLEAIRKDLAKGKPALMKRYDAAYVAQVEAERGPIGVDEYARLAVASERGTVGEAVAEMGLPSGAPMRIERVWMERMALDAAFGEKVRAAVEQGRAA